MRPRVQLFLLAWLCVFAYAFANPLDDAWNSGDLARLRLLVQSASDSPAKTFYQAMLEPEQSKASELLESIKIDDANADAKRYCTLARIELAKMALLDRDSDAAIRHLNTVSIYANPEIDFWQASAWLAMSDWARCIQSAQKFITASDDSLMIESAWFTIAEAYSRKGDHNRALSTLHAIKSSESLQNVPLMLYLLGYNHEMLGDWDNAKGYYRRLMVEYAYTAHAYRAEDRMMALRKREEAGLDVRDFSICDQDRESATIERQTSPESGEPTLKFWLQIGAFSTVSRAQNRANELKSQGYPSGVFSKVVNGKQWQVAAVGPFTDRAEALDMKQKLSEKGLSAMLLQRY